MQNVGAAEITSAIPMIATYLQAANPIFSGYTVQVSINSVTFGTPAIQITPSTAGLAFDLAVPQLNINVVANDSLGFQIATGTITADAVTVSGVAQLGVAASGGLQVTFPSSNIAFQNFDLQIGGLLGFLGPIAQPLILPVLQSQVQSLIQTQGPTAIAALIDQAATFSLGTSTAATFTYALDAIATDANGIAFVTGFNVALTPDPSYPSSPGSLDSPGALPATFSTLPTAVFSISEPAINRTLQQAWQAGELATVVYPSVLTQLFGGTSLPIGATGQDLVQLHPRAERRDPGSGPDLPDRLHVHVALAPDDQGHAGSARSAADALRRIRRHDLDRRGRRPASPGPHRSPWPPRSSSGSRSRTASSCRT